MKIVRHAVMELAVWSLSVCVVTAQEIGQKSPDPQRAKAQCETQAQDKSGMVIDPGIPLIPSFCVSRQSLNDAWWTGPLLANSAATLPRGHFLVEPYVYDVISAHSNGYGSRAYVLYGLANRLTVGFIPIVGFNSVSNGPSSSGLKFGDLTPQVQVGLTEFHPGSWVPSTAVLVQQSLPTGKYDRLGNRPSDGMGSGVYTTTVALNSQTYFWLPNGHILRMRFNVSEGFSTDAKISGVSVYGTGTGFRGRADPGRSFFVNGAWEYSLSREWVLAFDATYLHTGDTRVTGHNMGSGSLLNAFEVRTDSDASDAFGFAPAIEYNWTRNLGVIIGARLIPASHNTSSTITPAVAINFVH